MIEVINIIEIGIIGVTIVRERYLLIEGDLCQMGFIAWVRGSRFNVQEGNVVIIHRKSSTCKHSKIMFTNTQSN